MSVLAIVPTYLRADLDAELHLRCLVSLWSTAPDAEVLVVDDASPATHLVDQLEAAVAELGQTLVRKPVNEGFARTVNVGLRRALDAGQDALLVNADLQFLDAGWLEAMLARQETGGRPAAVVGARLIYPSGLIQHGGIYFSGLTHTWEHRFVLSPPDLPEALEPAVCPVTGALQLIRHDVLRDVGLYDETFKMAFEDVDYCLRVFAAGRECVYEPAASAIHYESVFRLRASETRDEWYLASARRLREKHAETDCSRWIPEVC